MISSGPTTISDGTITFREVRREDSELLYRWRFLHAPTRRMFRTSVVVPMEQHEAMIERYFDPANTDRWFIVEYEGTPVGTISLVNRSEDGTQYEWGRGVLDPARRGLGLGRRTYALLLEYCRAIGLHRIIAEVFDDNTASLGLVRDLGFREFGSDEHDGRRLILVERDPRTP